MGGSYSSTAVVGGHVSQGYETVREMFRRNVETGRERNAQLCVFVDGECVLDLWGSAEGDPDYTGDSLQCVFSTSKAVTAIAVAQLVDRGFLNYSNPVANYWPEFGAELKASITVAEMLKHEGGIPHLHIPAIHATTHYVSSVLTYVQTIWFRRYTNAIKNIGQRSTYALTSVLTIFA